MRFCYRGLTARGGKWVLADVSGLALKLLFCGTDIDNYYETIFHDLSYIFREDGKVNVREGKRLLWKGWTWWQWDFSSGQTLCGLVLWRSTYQNRPTEGFWPVCPILPEYWDAPKGAVLQPILIEDLLPGETAFPLCWAEVGMAGCGVMGGFLILYLRHNTKSCLLFFFHWKGRTLPWC